MLDKIKTASFKPASIYTLLILALGAGVSLSLLATAPKPQKEDSQRNITRVGVRNITPNIYALTITSAGTIEAKHRIELAAEVGGKVIEVSPKLSAGNRLSAGDLLLRIDPRDYEVALIQAQSQLATARQSLIQEQENARLAKEDWQHYGASEANSLALREPQLASAKAQLDSAKAQVRQAKINLERASVRMPFDGFIEEKAADIGQLISPNQKIATVFASDMLEVKLPVSAQDINLLAENTKKLLFSHGTGVNIPVELKSADWSEDTKPLLGKIVRLERALDQQTRLYNLVAEVPKPFDQKRSMTIATGMFVTAKITGKIVENTIEVPITSIIDDENLLVVTSDNTLTLRPVELLQKTSQSVVVRANTILANDKIIPTLPKTYFVGMHVIPYPYDDVGSALYAETSGDSK